MVLRAEVNRTAGRAGIVLVQLGMTKPSLDDSYLAMVSAGGDQ